jgi:hypothetical protein
MPMPGIYDLELVRGDSAYFEVELWEDAAATIPTVITGATAKAEIREKTAGIYIVELTCVITPPNRIAVTMTAAMWVNCPSKGVWDLQITMPSGEVRTVLAGKVTTFADVTDSVAAPGACVSSRRAG